MTTIKIDARWPVARIVQPLSPMRDCGVFQPGDLVLPYWVVRPPHVLPFSVHDAKVVWQLWAPREEGGGFIGEFEEPVTGGVETLKIYGIADNLHVGRFMLLMRERFELAAEMAERRHPWELTTERRERRGLPYWGAKVYRRGE